MPKDRGPQPPPAQARHGEDELLAVRAAEGDEGAFATLVRGHGPGLLGLAARMLGGRREAEDAVRDAFVGAWRRLPEFRGTAGFGAWMHRMVVNRCQNMVRATVPEPTAPEPPPDDGAGPAAAAALAEGVMRVVRAEPRPGARLPLGEPDEDLWVGEATAATSLRAAAEKLPGVRAGSCRIRPADRGPVHVRMEVVVPLVPGLLEFADEIRRRVRAAADEAVGMPVADIDIVVLDVTSGTGDGGRP